MLKREAMLTEPLAKKVTSVPPCCDSIREVISTMLPLPRRFERAPTKALAAKSPRLLNW